MKTLSGIGEHPVLSLPAFAPRRRRMALCVLAAASIHLVVIFSLDLPSGAPPALPAVIELKLAAAPILSERIGEAPDRPESVAESPAEVPPAPTDAAPPQPVPSDPSQLVAPPQPAPDALAGKTVSDLAREIASLEAGGDAPIDQRTRRLSGSPAGNTELAYYVESWRRKIERIGKINYPAEARSKGLTGTLRLLVSIAADGTLVDVRVLEPSDHEVLDEAAVRIVELGAPYAPFPPRLRDSTDLLEIERTWQFRGDRLSWK